MPLPAEYLLCMIIVMNIYIIILLISLSSSCEIYFTIIVYSYPLVEMVQTQIWNRLRLNQQTASLRHPYKDTVLKAISFCHPWKVMNLLGILSHRNIVIQYIILEAVLIQSQGNN